MAAAALATLGLLSGGTASASTTFQTAYMYGTSGPAGGGTPVNLVGNQFVAGATVTFGGQTVSSTVTNSTRISATSPGLNPGALYDVVVTNPGGPSGVLTRGWFADFTDVPQASPFHAPVEAIIRDGITSGCGGGNYCASSSVTRAQMAVFLLRAGHGSAYVPPPATGTVFTDVSAGDFAADWIEQLYAEGVTGGCATNPLRYCPTSSVTRAQMATFLLKIYHGAGYAPPAATGVFSDVPTSMPLAPWVEELARLVVTTGCGGTSYCPNNPVTRGQMAVFLAKTFHRNEAARFLEQATWGPKDSEISGLLGTGYLPWLAAQYGAAPSLYPAIQMVPDTQPGACDIYCNRFYYTTWPLHTAFFTNALYNSDQLRQRVFFALQKIDVASTNVIARPGQFVPYLNILAANAFGNYRDILEQITLNPAMGAYLNMSTSTKTNPNENYAREIMQLFSIGTELLNQDGTTQNDLTGAPLPSYDQSVIDNLKLVFTGWYIPNVTISLLGTSDDTGDYINPMPIHKNGSNQEDRHDQTTKTLFLGFLPNQNGDGSPTVIPAGQAASTDLDAAIDALFYHPNTGPYLARELIHSLVTSNPSPAYIERVAGFFNDNGSGQRGSLWAMAKAVLLDPEARNAPSDQTYGKLKEPAEYILNVLRAFDAQSANRAAPSDGYINTPYSRDMGEEVFRANTVFSYFPQDYYAPPASAGLFGPEFGIMDASTSLKRANFVNTIVFSSIPVSCGTNSCNAPAGTSINLVELQQLAATPSNLVDRLNRLMMHGTMSDEMRSSIETAVSAVSSSNSLLRARQALYLVATASQYQVQR